MEPFDQRLWRLSPFTLCVFLVVCYTERVLTMTIATSQVALLLPMTILLTMSNVDLVMSAAAVCDVEEVARNAKQQAPGGWNDVPREDSDVVTLMELALGQATVDDQPIEGHRQNNILQSYSQVS